MSQAIYRKWRPRRFADVIGQEHITKTLQNAVASERIGHAYLFCGPRGTGKTTSARLLAKAVNCTTERPDGKGYVCDDTCHICDAIDEGRFLDLIEIDAASNTGVDDIRELRDKINFSPVEGRFKVYIIDEVHMLSTAAFNALLKTLEEPPAHAIFVLATTEEHKILPTIKSRCQQFNFRLLSLSEITKRLMWLVEKENLTIDPAAIHLIAQEGAGSLRDAESLLDQLITVPDDMITLERVQQLLGTVSMRTISELVDAWLTADTKAGLQLIDDALSIGTDARQFCRQMVSYLRQMLLLKSTTGSAAVDLTTDQYEIMMAQVKRAHRDQLITTVKRFNEAALSPSNNWQPQLPLELAFIESVIPSVSTSSIPPVETASASTTAATPIRQAAVSAPPASPSPQPDDTLPDVETIIMDTDNELSITAIKAQWNDVLDFCGKYDRGLPPLLKMGRIMNVEGTVLILGFQYPIFKDKFDNHAKAKTIVLDGIKAIYGRDLTMRTVISDNYKVVVPSTTKKSVQHNSEKHVEPITHTDVEALAQELGGVVRRY